MILWYKVIIYYLILFGNYPVNHSILNHEASIETWIPLIGSWFTLYLHKSNMDTQIAIFDRRYILKSIILGIHVSSGGV